MKIHEIIDNINTLRFDTSENENLVKDIYFMSEDKSILIYPIEIDVDDEEIFKMIEKTKFFDNVESIEYQGISFIIFIKDSNNFGICTDLSELMRANPNYNEIEFNMIQ